MNLPLRPWTTLCLATLLAAIAAAAGAAAPPPPEGLVAVKSKRVDKLWLLPDTDFRPYTKVLIDPAEVAFRKDWLRNMNRTHGLSERISTEDAQEIAAAARSGFGDIFADAFRKAGYAIATAPGEDVLRLSPQVVDLYINAPDTQSSARSRTYTVEAGQARLILEVRDSMSGALLGVATDRRSTRSAGGGIGWAGGMTWTTRVSNSADFAALFRSWSAVCVTGLQELKERSPVPAPAAN